MPETTNKLRIHTQITPEEEPVRKDKERIHWRCIPHAASKGRTKLAPFDRLLRNSALACAVLLGVLSLGNIDHPIARRTSNSIRQALSMHIDLDESIGSLTFVRELMPESALVFLNLSDRSEYALPCRGELMHSYSNAQPWLLFSCQSAQDVFACEDGTVTAHCELSDGSVGMLIDHGNGIESVYAYLESVSVEPGELVSRGQSIGTSTSNLYYELRSGGDSIDPSGKMGL